MPILKLSTLHSVSHGTQTHAGCGWEKFWQFSQHHHHEHLQQLIEEEAEHDRAAIILEHSDKREHILHLSCYWSEQSQTKQYKYR